MSPQTATDAAAAAQQANEEERRRAALRTGMILALWAQRRPDAMAIVSEVGDRTFAELNTRANQVARALRERGLGRGDALALMCSNRPEFAEVMAGCQRAGFRVTPVNWHLTGDEAGYIVDDCEAKAFVSDSRFADNGAEAAALAPRAKVRLAVGGDIAGFEGYESAIGAQPGGDIDDPVLGTTMLYTSGTTGRPKGVHRSPGSRADGVVPVSQAASAAASAEAGGPPMHLCTGPLYHAAPLAFSLSSPLAQGMGVVLMDRWDAEATLGLIERHRITHTHMVPTMFHRILSLPREVRARYDVSSLRYVIHGAAPCPVHVKQAIIDWWGPIVVEYYAATEGGGTFVTSDDWLQRPGTVGQARHCRPCPDPRRRWCRASGGTDRDGVPEGARGQAVQLLQGRAEDVVGVSRRLTSRSATSAISTRTGTSSSPTAAPTSSSPAA